MQRPEFHAFATALTRADQPLPPGLRTASGSNLSDRFAVYRNNVMSSLLAALADQFIVCRALVGEACFEVLGRQFLAIQWPRSADLLLLGSDFPEFLRTHAEATQWPWLADVAQLEMYWTQSWGARDAPRLLPTDLQHLSPEALMRCRFRLHPTARLLNSTWPVASLWQAHHDQGENLSATDLSKIQWQAETVLLTRPDAHVEVTVLKDGSAQFAARLAAGDPIEVAADQALTVADFLDISTALKGLLESGLAESLEDS